MAKSELEKTIKRRRKVKKRIVEIILAVALLVFINVSEVFRAFLPDSVFGMIDMVLLVIMALCVISIVINRIKIRRFEETEDGDEFDAGTGSGRRKKSSGHGKSTDSGHNTSGKRNAEENSKTKDAKKKKQNKNSGKKSSGNRAEKDRISEKELEREKRRQAERAEAGKTERDRLNAQRARQQELQGSPERTLTASAGAKTRTVRTSQAGTPERSSAAPAGTKSRTARTSQTGAPERTSAVSAGAKSQTARTAQTGAPERSSAASAGAKLYDTGIGQKGGIMQSDEIIRELQVEDILADTQKEFRKDVAAEAELDLKSEVQRILNDR